MNPDSDFVLHGKSSSYWSRPGYLSNSELTTTSRDVKNTDRSTSKISSMLRNTRHDLNMTSTYIAESITGGSSQVRDLNRSHMLTSTSRTDLELERLLDEQLRDNSNLKSTNNSEWYTSPQHKVTREYPIMQNRSVGYVLSELESDSRASHEMKYKRLAKEDALAACYFPVTLGAGYYLEAAGGESVKQFIENQRRGHSASIVGRTERHRRARSAARTEEILGDAYRSTNLHLLGWEAPTIASSINVISMTPYQQQLAKLRMERLKIEEDRLLQLKRQEELERIRGPQPKWYEMKSPQFHYEAHKNNLLMRSTDKWDDLLNYREDLVSASKELNRSYQLLTV